MMLKFFGLEPLADLLKNVQLLKKNLAVKNAKFVVVKNELRALPASEITSESEKDINSALKTYKLPDAISANIAKLGEISFFAFRSNEQAFNVMKTHLGDFTRNLNKALEFSPSCVGPHSLEAAKNYRDYLDAYSKLNLTVLESLKSSRLIPSDLVEEILKAKIVIEKCSDAVEKLDVQIKDAEPKEKLEQQKTISAISASAIQDSETADLDDESTSSFAQRVNSYDILDTDIPLASVSFQETPFIDERDTIVDEQELSEHERKTLSRASLVSGPLPETTKSQITLEKRLETQLQEQKQALKTIQQKNLVLEAKRKSLINEKEQLLQSVQQDPVLIKLKNKSQQAVFSELLAESQKKSDSDFEEVLSEIRRPENFKIFSEEFRTALDTQPETDWLGRSKLSPVQHLEACLKDEKIRVNEALNQFTEHKKQELQKKVALIDKELEKISDSINTNNEQLMLLGRKIKKAEFAPIDEKVIKDVNEKYDAYRKNSAQILNSLRFFLSNETDRLPAGDKKEKMDALYQQVNYAFEHSQYEILNQTLIERIKATSEILTTNKIGFKGNPFRSGTTSTRNLNEVLPEITNKMIENAKLKKIYDEVKGLVTHDEDMYAELKRQNSDNTFDKIKEKINSALETHSTDEQSTLLKFEKQLDFIYSLKDTFHVPSHETSLLRIAHTMGNYIIFNDTKSFIGEFYQEQLTDLDPSSNRSRGMDICLKPQMSNELQALRQAIDKAEKPLTELYSKKETYGRLLAYTNLLSDINVHGEKPTALEAEQIKAQLEHYQSLIDSIDTHKIPADVKEKMQDILNTAKNYIRTEEPEWAKAVGIEQSPEKPAVGEFEATHGSEM